VKGAGTVELRVEEGEGGERDEESAGGTTGEAEEKECGKKKDSRARAKDNEGRSFGKSSTRRKT
jgi:hypothetical protein